MNGTARNRDHSAIAQRPGGLAHGVGVVDDPHPDFLSRRAHIPLHQRVGHSARDGVELNATRADIRTTQFPIPQMPRDNDDTFALGLCRFEMLPPNDVFKAFENFGAGSARQNSRFDESAAKAFVRPLCEFTHGFPRQLRERGGDLTLRHVAADTEGPIGKSAEQCANSARGSPRRKTQRPDSGTRHGVFEAMQERWNTEGFAHRDRAI